MTSKRRHRLSLVLLLGGLSACGARPAVPLQPEPEPAVAPEFPFALAWTARADVAIRTDEGEVRVPNLFTRLNVVAVDTLGIRVQCLHCIPAVEGLVHRDQIVYDALPPEAAARRGLAELALAVRAASEQRDETALRPVMSRHFTFSFQGGGGSVDAFRRWEFQGFRALDNLAPLLDRGLVTRDSVIWSAPPEFLSDQEYQGLRAGFRRDGDGRWEWIYLIGG